MKNLLCVAALLLAGCAKPPASGVDPNLAAEIARIKAIDNHAHPVRPTGTGEPADSGYDALPVEGLEPQTYPVLFRPDGNPLVAKAAQVVFNGDKAGAMKAWGANYAATVLDRAGIDRMLANRVSMGAGLPPERFLWVGYIDALMYPFATGGLAVNPDRKLFFELEARQLELFRKESGANPASLDDYLRQVVTATLVRHKKGGAIAEKFEMAYLRSLAVGNPAKADAERVWRSGATNAADYRILQDFLFRYMAGECGRLGMAVHIHTGMGAGGYFDGAGSNPGNLEPLLNDPALRKTSFVMLHGGWPYSPQAASLLLKPNAYIDISVQGVFLPPSNMAQTLRAWLEIAPEKVLFGTDAYPMAPGAGMGWEETAWASTEAVRRALGMALTDMVNDGSVSRERAVEIARMVMRENALTLYGLK